MLSLQPYFTTKQLRGCDCPDSGHGSPVEVGRQSILAVSSQNLEQYVLFYTGIQSTKKTSVVRNPSLTDSGSSKS